MQNNPFEPSADFMKKDKQKKKEDSDEEGSDNDEGDAEEDENVDDKNNSDGNSDEQQEGSDDEKKDKKKEIKQEEEQKITEKKQSMDDNENNNNNQKEEGEIHAQIQSQKKSSGDQIQSNQARGTALEEKNSSFSQFKQWEDLRVQTVNVHRSLFENIEKKLEAKAEETIEQTQYLIKFLSQRVQQLHKFANFQQNQSKKLSQSKNDFKDFQEGFQKFEEVHSNQQKNFIEFAKFIEQDIVKDQLEVFSKDFSQKTHQFQTDFNQLKKKLIKSTASCIEKYKDYTKVFQETIKFSQSQKKQSEIKDMYMYEVVYMSKAFTTYYQQKDLGLLVLLFWEELQKLEEQKFQTYQQALTKYIEKYQQNFFDSQEKEAENLLNYLKNLNVPEEVKKQFEITQILTQDEINQLKKILEIENLNYENLKKFAEEFKLNDIQDTPLIVAVFEAKIQKTQKNQTESKWENYSLIHTIDKNLIIIQQEENGIFKKPEKIIKLTNLKCHFDAQSQQLEIGETKRTSIFGSSNKFIVKFEEKTQKEFIDNLKNYVEITGI